MTELVLQTLTAMRPPFALYEYDLHQMVESQFREAGLPYTHEARIGAGCRIDYLVEQVGIEIKKGKPVAAVLEKQLRRYAACEGISSLIVITQRSVKLPPRIGGKPLHALVLSQLWGVALP